MYRMDSVNTPTMQPKWLEPILHSINWLGILLLPQHRMLTHHLLTSAFFNVLRTHLYPRVEKGTVCAKYFVQKSMHWPRAGLELWPLKPESSALTVRLLHLPHQSDFSQPFCLHLSLKTVAFLSFFANLPLQILILQIASEVGDHFLHSCDLNVWFRDNSVGRN